MPARQDIMISVYNIHRSPAVWDDPDAFQPERFGPLDGPVPTEQNTDYHYIPFSGGPRCDGLFSWSQTLSLPPCEPDPRRVLM